jgi:hypothetical protein
VGKAALTVYGLFGANVWLGSEEPVGQTKVDAESAINFWAVF